MAVLLTILIIVAATLVVLGAIVLRNRYPAGATEMGLAMLAGGVWVTSAALEILLGSDPVLFAATRVMRYIGTSFVPLFFLLFALRYVLGVRLDRRWVALLAVVPTASIAVVATNSLHDWMWISPGVPMVTGMERPPWGPWFRFVHVPVLYGMLLVALGALVTELIRGSVLRRAQTAVLVLGSLVPFLVNVVFITNLDLPDLQQTPLSFGFTALLFSWGFFRFRIFRVNPLALRTVFDTVGDAVVLIDADERISDLNPAACRILGVEPPGPLGRAADGVVEEAGIPQIQLADGVCARLEVEDGRTLETDCRAIRAGRNETVRGYVLVLRDISERIDSERQLRESEAMVRGVVEGSPLGILRLRPERENDRIRDFRCVLSNPVADGALLPEGGTVQDRSITDVRPPHAPVLMDVFRRVARSGERESVVFPASHPEWGDRWIRLQTTAIGDDLLVTFVDATREMEMESAANHDDLTGLPNRRGFERDIRLLIDSALAQGGVAALFFVDLDRFKEVNDEHGHLVGDEVLAQFGRRLQECLRVDDLVGRLGGDEFVAFVHGSTHEEVEGIARRVRSVGEAPYRIGRLRLRVGASVGQAFIPDDGTSLEELVRAADAAMYREKT